MCTKTIIDRDTFGDFMDSGPNAKLGLLREWISKGNGVVVYSKEEGYEKRDKHSRFHQLLAEYHRSDRAILISSSIIEQEQKKIDALNVKSDDRYVLALARASDALVLCSKDQNLHKDFRNTDILPKVGRKSRNVYPLKEELKVQRKFLYSRRCVR